ncbi:MAG TPA: type II CAAX endopeptidase family protein [Candidatus Sulfotelmatobacter sp.]|nr:type II CAAX endopeptidase family protein [Candidatus Sulfotelmatobacter sp.]
MNANSRTWQLGLPAAIALWGAIVTSAAIFGTWIGLGGRRFAIALGVAAVLFAFELFLAAPRVLAQVRSRLGERGAVLAALVPLFVALIYSIGVTGDWRWLLAGAAYAVLPALVLASSAGKPPGTWADYAMAIFIWLAVWLPPPYRLLYRIFPYPYPLMHTLAILMALSTAVAAYVVVRRMDGIGYAVDWGRGFAFHFGFNFVAFAAIAIPLGIKIGFLTFGPSFTAARLVGAPIGILFFTAWPEEFLFRGIIQNSLARTFKNPWVGLGVASVIFGFSHILHSPVPNWKYVLLATIAGVFYGRAWMKSGSLLPGTLVHALVDISWHVLFK